MAKYSRKDHENDEEKEKEKEKEKGKKNRMGSVKEGKQADKDKDEDEEEEEEEEELRSVQRYAQTLAREGMNAQPRPSNRLAIRVIKVIDDDASRNPRSRP